MCIVYSNCCYYPHETKQILYVHENAGAAKLYSGVIDWISNFKLSELLRYIIYVWVHILL